MDLERIRKLAGLENNSTVSPSQLNEKKCDDKEKKCDDDYMEYDGKTNHKDDMSYDKCDKKKKSSKKSQKVDFTNKKLTTLKKLEEAIADKSGRLFSLSEDAQESSKDIKSLGLRKVANVVDLDELVYFVYENAKSDLWFYAPADSGMIQETFLTMDELQAFHNSGEDIVMRESDVVNEAVDDMLDDAKKKLAKIEAAIKNVDEPSIAKELKSQAEKCKAKIEKLTAAKTKMNEGMTDDEATNLQIRRDKVKEKLKSCSDSDEKTELKKELENINDKLDCLADEAKDGWAKYSK